jgi:hypothetical protein
MPGLFFYLCGTQFKIVISILFLYCISRLRKEAGFFLIRGRKESMHPVLIYDIMFRYNAVIDTKIFSTEEMRFPGMPFTENKKSLYLIHLVIPGYVLKNY